MSKKFKLNDDSVTVVIGSGAGGGVLSNELAQQGIDVVCLEAGPRLTMGDIVNDEAVMFKKLTWLDERVGSGDLDPSLPIFTCKTVGGTTMHWTALSLRMAPHELKPLTTYGEIPDTTLIDWPIDFNELEPYFEMAEFKMGVAGTNGLPRHPGNGNFLVLEAGAKKLGYKEVETGNLAINSIARDGRPKCLQLGFCKSGCAVGAKWSTMYTEIPKAETTGHFEIRPESMVLQLTHNQAGKITGVVYADASGKIHEQKARAVCVAGNAIETPRLLLNSNSNLFPDGIGNQNGHVGRNYMRHMVAGIAALMPGEVNFHRGIQQSGAMVDERYHDPKRDFISGYRVETAPMSPERLASTIDPKGWGKRYTDILEQYNHFAACIIVGEDFSTPHNGISLHSEKKDQYGLPVPVIHYEDHANSKVMRAHSLKTASNIYEAVGAKKTYSIPFSSSTHNMGSCRMAEHEQDGVCDRWGKVFGTSNLFISDGSQFSSSTSVNPTLTIVALAIRQAEQLTQQFSKGIL